jgi:AraC-like DNA-binding protein
MGYRELPPVHAPADLVTCVWERHAGDGTRAPTTRVLPDACVDIVWNGERLFVAGPDTRAVVSTARPHRTIAGLRFRPGAAGAGLGLPAAELRDLRVDLADLWGDAARELADRLAGAPSGAAQRRLLETAVAGRLAATRRPDPLVLAAARALGRPGSRVAALAGRLGVGERQLLRRFDADVGYGPKVLDRVLRFQRFLARIRAGTVGRDGLARVAGDLGYADQAHLTRECRRLSGLTPGELVAARAPAAD